jgi:hypothetical protein
LSGNYYGGVCYNIDFKSGIWNGGILDDIQVVGINTDDNYILLNGIFKFNIGDQINILDNDGNSVYNQLGSNISPISYNILSYLEDGKFTVVYLDRDLESLLGQSINIDSVNTGLRVVSIFRNCNWKSGIWTNGIYQSGNWEGGIWYNGIFESNGIFM